MEQYYYDYEIKKAFLTNGGYHNNPDCIIGEVEDKITDEIYYYYYNVEVEYLALFKRRLFNYDFNKFSLEISKCYHDGGQGFEALLNKEITLEEQQRYKEASEFVKRVQREAFEKAKDIIAMKIETIYNIINNFGKYDYQ